MTPEIDPHIALAMLDWQIELGATEAIGDVPINRFELVPDVPKPKPAAMPDLPVKKAIGPTGIIAKPSSENLNKAATAAAELAANAATDLTTLKAAIASFEHCELKKGARNLVFADGNPVARLMIIGEAPGRDEDREGLPFVGQAGHLLDKMLGAIDLDRKSEDANSAVYITNVLPWRPPQNRDPSPDEMAMMLPFLHRHIALVAPDIIVPMGNIACQALLGMRGISRLRGNWSKIAERPAMPMFHPAYLLRTPAAKREAWADLLELKSRLKAQS